MPQVDAKTLAEKLFREGYVVVNGVFPNLRGALEEAFIGMPEFKQHFRFDESDAHHHKLDKTHRYGCGGTSFMSNPSVFHNLTSQRFRTRTAAYVMPILAEFIPKLGNPNLMLARYLDRVQVRPPFEVPDAESWHRDAPPQYAQGEFWMGGYQNCDLGNQNFAAIKGTHKFNSSAAGFDPIPEAEHVKYDAMLLNQANQEDTDAEGNIIVPPDHFILWVSTIAHKVYGKAVDSAHIKHFLGFRITPHANTSGVYIKGKPLSLEVVQRQMVDNDVMVLPSGQIPTIYPANYINFPANRAKFFEPLQRDVLRENAMRTPDYHKDGTPIKNDVYRAMRSLRDMGAPCYPYNETELNLVVPQRNVHIFNFDTNETEIFPINYGSRRTPNRVYDVPEPLVVTDDTMSTVVTFNDKHKKTVKLVRRLTLTDTLWLSHEKKVVSAAQKAIEHAEEKLAKAQTKLQRLKDPLKKQEAALEVENARAEIPKAHAYYEKVKKDEPARLAARQARIDRRDGTRKKARMSPSEPSPSKRSPKGKARQTRKSPQYSSSDDDLQADRDAIARMEQDEQDRRDAKASGATSSKAPIYDVDDSDDDVVYLHTKKG